MANQYKCTSPACGAEETSDKAKQFCSECRAPMQLVESGGDSLLAMSEDDALWETRVFDAAPSIIAHEYWRLRQEAFCQVLFWSY